MDLLLFKPDPGFVRNDLLYIASDAGMMIGAQVSFWGYPTGYSGKMALLGVGVSSRRSAGRQSCNPVINGAINKGNSGGPLLETKNATIVSVVIQKWNPCCRTMKRR